MLLKFKLFLSQIDPWPTILGLSIEFLLRILLIFIWNWIFSTNTNQFLFGEDQLGYLKGFVLISLVFILFPSNKSSVFNQINTKGA